MLNFQAFSLPSMAKLLSNTQEMLLPLVKKSGSGHSRIGLFGFPLYKYSWLRSTKEENLEPKCFFILP